ncbi:hypothetical protein [Shewanella aestuarii]|uniref:PRTRC system protein B n=1 Tax=Shewanella aestuarii TaxID=1028752 RepID=A0A6G9QQZ9_9GAMM|nr:hypothetical protein [Shewanella aestuarii]QIR16467.1 hypothetical protein HBH39_18520 [Shewanella aestuarii]
MIPQNIDQSEVESLLQDGFKTVDYNVNPSFAVVVYTNSNQSRVTMTRHAIKNNQLSGGEVINAAQVIEMINSEASTFGHSQVNKNAEVTFKTGIIDQCILAKNFNSIIWHRPRQRKTMFLYKEQITLNLPPLLFKFSLSSGLEIYAIRYNKRPNESEPLYHAPFMNIYSTGKLCTGTMTLPKNIGFDTISEVESEFFNSVFTHANHSGILRKQKSTAEFTKYTKKKSKSGDKILISELAETGKTVSSLLS